MRLQRIITRVDIPGSKLKMEVARILKEEGYINNFATKGEGIKYMIRDLPSLRCERDFFDHASVACFASGPPCLCRLGRDPASSWRIRREHRFDVEGLMSGKKARQENVGGEILAEIY